MISQSGGAGCPLRISASAFDSYNDIALLTGVRDIAMSEESGYALKYEDWIRESRPVLEKSGIVTYNEDGSRFVSMRNLQWLQIDALRQEYEKGVQREEKITKLEDRILNLESLLGSKNQ